MNRLISGTTFNTVATYSRHKSDIVMSDMDCGLQGKTA